MRSTKFAMLVLAAAAAVSMAACQAGPSAAGRVPRIDVDGTRAFEYRSLADLTTHASAVVVARPTGRTSTRPFPYGGPGAAPTAYVQMHVTSVVSGTVPGADIDVVTPGDDTATQRSALLSAGAYLLFLTPAMYGPGDPAGGYAIVGGPAGTYAQHGAAGQFVKVDTGSAALPDAITLGATAIPRVTKSEHQLLSEGPH